MLSKWKKFPYPLSRSGRRGEDERGRWGRESVGIGAGQSRRVRVMAHIF